MVADAKPSPRHTTTTALAAVSNVSAKLLRWAPTRRHPACAVAARHRAVLPRDTGQATTLATPRWWDVACANTAALTRFALAELPTDALRNKALAMLQSAPTRRTTRPQEEPLAPETAPAPAVLENDHDQHTTGQLLAGYASTLTELRRRGVIRSNNAPAGDYGEWLVAKALEATIAANAAMRSYDLTTADGRRVQVKTRVVSVPVRRGQLQASVFRSFDFDLAALVLLRDVDYAVHRAVLVPVHLVQEMSSRVEHVNGWRLMMTSEVLDHQEAEDITAAARRAAREA